DGVVPGVAYRLEESAAAGPVVPALLQPAGGVVPQVKVCAPLFGGGRGRVGARGVLAQVAELVDVPVPAPRACELDHVRFSLDTFFDECLCDGWAAWVSVANGSSPLLAHQLSAEESVVAERPDELRSASGGDEQGKLLSGDGSCLEPVGAPADVDQESFDLGVAHDRAVVRGHVAQPRPLAKQPHLG